MTQRIDRIAMLAVALATGQLACRSRERTPPPPPPPAEPAARAEPGLRLVVLIVVDQLPAWSFERDRAVLDGGLAHLVERGIYYPRAEYPFASTSTASGHAALATGAPPRLTGILGNKWYHREDDSSHEATDDPDQPVLAALPGARPTGGQSSRALLAPGVADAMRSASAARRGRSVSISLKDRSAILAAGQQADLAVWYDETQPAMTTSRAYAERPPAWLSAYGRAHPIASRFTEVWEPSSTELLARHTANVDDGAGEGDSDGGLGHVFPHVPARAAAPAVAFLATPMATDLVFDTAEAALTGEGLGTDDAADYLAISVSSHDYAGHAWGQESWERLDLLLRLDRRLGEFLDFLDRNVGADRYAVLVTSDHGAVPLIERGRAAGHDVHRVSRAGLLEAAERGARKALGRGRWVADYQAGTVYMSAAYRARSEDHRRAALVAAAAEISRIPGMGLVRASAELVGACATRAAADERLACETLSAQLSGELYAAPAEGSLITDSPTGTAHGTPSASDRIVPIILAIPGLAPRVDDRPTSILRVAPTLSHLLGVPPPVLATEPALP